MKSKQAQAVGARSFMPVHPAVDPVIKELHALLLQHPGHVMDLCNLVGVDKKTPRRWFSRGSPTLSAFRAMANSLGYELTLRRKT